MLLAALAASVPLLWPDIPPLVDLPGHMGRFRVQQSWASEPHLHDWYRFEWALIGNLGIDLLMVVLEPLIGLEPAVKLVVLTIPPLTVLGLLWIAREVHGRIPATALFALPLAYNFPFHFGFVNFALSMALALNAFALWLRLARLGHTRLRAALFVPIGMLIWVVHVYGWAVLGVLAASAETMRYRQGGRDWRGALWQAAITSIVLAPPLLLMLAWQAPHAGVRTARWFEPTLKAQWLISLFRDRWQFLDLASAFVVYALLYAGARSRNLRYRASLVPAAILLAVLFFLLPVFLFGSAYADMRLAPYAAAIGLVAIYPGGHLDRRQLSVIAILGLAFFTMRIGATAVSLYLYDRAFKQELAALDHLPKRARLISFTGFDCGDDWRTERFEHLPSFALVRRLSFANDQWLLPGAQLMRIETRGVGAFGIDPSQITVASRCDDERWLTIDEALSTFPRNQFTHLWLIDPPPYQSRLLDGMTPLWRHGSSGLYAIGPRRDDDVR